LGTRQGRQHRALGGGSQTPDDKPVDVIDVNDHTKKYASGLKPGSVSDYIRVSKGAALAGSDGKSAVTQTVKATVAGGHSGYVLPWLGDRTHLRFLFVPITSPKPCA
jgi:hypothetical protein